MPSTYSASLALELMETGEKAGLWGGITNTNLGALLEESISGMGSVVFSLDANTSIVMLNGTSCAARCAFLNVTSSVPLTAIRDLVVPTITKLYVVLNATTGGQSIQVKTLAGTGITVPNGKTQVLYVNGTNVVDAITNLPASVTIGGVALPLPADIVTLTGIQTLTNKTLTAPIISTISNTGTLTLPTTTDTLVGRDTTDTLTNKTLTSPVIATPVVTGGTFATPTITSPLIDTSLTLKAPAPNYGVTGGTANAQTLNLTPDLGAYVSGQVFHPKFSLTSTSTTPQLTIDALAALNLKQPDGSALSFGGELSAGMVQRVLYDGTDGRLLDIPWKSGSWTSTLTCGTSGTITIGSQTLRYFRIGALVWVGGTIAVSAISAPTGALIVNGLPFAGLNVSGVGYVGVTLDDFDYASVNPNAITPYFQVTAGATTATINVTAKGGTTATQCSVGVKTTTTIRLWGFYISSAAF